MTEKIDNPGIDNDEYQLAQSMVMQIARLVRTLPLKKVLEAISKAEAVGPILDPTLYREGSRNMQDFKQLVVKLRAFQAEIEAQLEKVGVRGG